VFSFLKADPHSLYKIVQLADALRVYDFKFRDGGSSQFEAIESYHHAIRLSLENKQIMVERGEETNRSLSGTVDVTEEVTMDFPSRSVDGALCGLYCALGKTYFMANMFEEADESYTSCLEIEPFYLDALNSRGATRIILGQYEEAAQDLETVMQKDTKGIFPDVFTSLARVLQAKESALPGGWERMVAVLNAIIPPFESQLAAMEHPIGKDRINTRLAGFYHILFYYNDIKTKDNHEAWEALTRAYHHKMAALPAWTTVFEQEKMSTTNKSLRRDSGLQELEAIPRFPFLLLVLFAVGPLSWNASWMLTHKLLGLVKTRSLMGNWIKFATRL
jgi:tetratricopeptide (TPR) repeat protein